MKHHSVSAQEHPEKAAIIMGRGETVTYGDFHKRVNQTCHYFKSIGLKPGDHIAIFMENTPIYLIYAMAAIDSGLFVTPISVHLQPDEIEYIVNNSNSKVLLVSSKFSNFASEIAEKTPHVENYLMVNGDVAGYDDFLSAIGAMPTTPIEYGVAGNFMFYSSGTTGRPKGIAYKGVERQVLEPDAKLAGVTMALGIGPDSVYLSPAPLYHSAPAAGCAAALLSGATVVVMEHFDPEEALALIERHRVTASQWVPTMFVRLLKLPAEVRARYDVSSLKTAVHAAAPCPPDVKESMIKWWGDAILEYWGGSETGVITFITAQQALTHRGSVGRSVGPKIHILDEDQNELPAGEVGLIYVESPEGFEYHDEPEKTASSTSKQGYQSIGDTGFLDNEGFLYLTGRKSHMIISGGVNIYPEETENHLITHPKVMDVGVIGVPHPEFGEEEKAIVQLVDHAEASPTLEAELIGFCREAMSHIKCPRSVDFVAELPRTPAGKLRKHEMRAPYWEGAGRTI